MVAELVTIIVLVVAAVTAVAAIISSVYIGWIFNQRQEDALFLTRLVHRDIRVSLASAVILGYLALVMLGYSLGKPWGALVIGIPVIIMMWGPVSDARLWHSERTERTRRNKLTGRQS